MVEERTGEALQGVVDQGVVDQGVVDQGVVDQGVVDQGVVDQGVVDQGVVDQGVVDQAPEAAHYFSDGFNVYPTLMYAPGDHAVAPGKSQTYSVEGGNADLRHYLARLGRRSRCFSRCAEALRRAVFLFVHCFVHCYNARQLWQQAHPKYKAAVIDFLPLLL